MLPTWPSSWRRDARAERFLGGSMTVYKFVELPVVTEDTREETVNAWVGKGWALEAIRFIVTEHSRRPAMAFVSFVRDGAPEVTEKPPVAAVKPAPVALGQDDEPLR